MQATRLALLVLFALIACSRKTETTETAPSGPTRGLRPADEPGQPEAKPEPIPAPFEFPQEAKPAEEPKPVQPGEAAAAEEGPPPRDYAGELRGLVGSPSGCLKPRVGAQAPHEISVTVEAVVMESGMISRAYARSSELDDEELACIRARLSTARMQPEVEQAPRSVSTNVMMVLQPSAARPAPTEPGAEQPPAAEGAAEPGAQPSTVEPGTTQQAPAPEAPTGYGQPEAPPAAPEQPQENQQ